MVNSVARLGSEESVLATARLDVDPEDARAAAAVLSRDERARAQRFACVRDTRRFIVARARLRQFLGSLLSLQPAAIEFSYGPNGKPALAARHRTRLRFNVAHSGDVAVFVAAMGREVGVDIEVVRPLADADDVASWAFSARERADYFSLPAAARPVAFFNCWTRKEAVVKAMGDGLRFPLAAFDVSLAPSAPARLLRMEHRGRGRGMWTLRAISPAPGVVGAIALRCAADTVTA